MEIINIKDWEFDNGDEFYSKVFKDYDELYNYWIKMGYKNEKQFLIENAGNDEESDREYLELDYENDSNDFEFIEEQLKHDEVWLQEEIDSKCGKPVYKNKSVIYDLVEAYAKGANIFIKSDEAKKIIETEQKKWDKGRGR